MGAYDWHADATAKPAALPSALLPGVLRALPERERTAYAKAVRKALRSTVVDSPIHDRLCVGLADSLERALEGPPGIRTVLALSAPATLGKTTAVKQWAQEHYLDWIGRHSRHRLATHRPRRGIVADHTPVVWVSLRKATRSKGLYLALLGFLGYEQLESKSEALLALHMPKALRNAGVRLVILDDAHMLYTGNQTGRQIVDAVKHLATEIGEAGGVLMLVGADLGEHEVLQDQQIAGRLSRHDLTPYAVDTDAQRGDWQRLLRGIERLVLPYLPEAEPGVIANRCAGYLWERTQGYVGDTTQLVAEAVGMALATGEPITPALMDGCQVVSQRAVDGAERRRRAKAKPTTPNKPTTPKKST